MIKKLLKSVREYKTASIIVPVLMAVEAIMEIVIPFLMTFIVGELQAVAEDKTGTREVDINVIIVSAVLMIVCAVIALIAGAAGAKLAAKASSGFAHNLREDMYNNLQTFSFANIDNYSTASLITRITTDVTNVQNAYQMAIRMLVRAPILFIASIIMTIVIEPIMALIFGGESKDPDKVYEAICREFDRLKTEGVSAADFERCKKALYGKYIGIFSSSSSIATVMMETHFFGLGAFDVLEVLSGLTLEQLEARLRENVDTARSALSIVRPMA